MTVEGRALKLTNLDKVLYPKAGFTKGDVIDYYRRIAPVLLPHLEGRAADAQALPERRRGPVLLREELPVAPARLGADRCACRCRSKTIDFCLCEDLPTLVWLANLADLELHTSLSRGRRRRSTPDDPRLRPRPGRAGDDRRVLPRRRCGSQGMFERLGLRVRSPRRRARRGCRSTSR